MAQSKHPADGPGEAVIDEPTEHALDAEPDPNTEWERDAADQMSEDEGSESKEQSEGSDDQGAMTTEESSG